MNTTCILPSVDVDTCKTAVLLFLVVCSEKALRPKLLPFASTSDFCILCDNVHDVLCLLNMTLYVIVHSCC